MKISVRVLVTVYLLVLVGLAAVLAGQINLALS